VLIRFTLTAYPSVLKIMKGTSSDGFSAGGRYVMQNENTISLFQLTETEIRVLGSLVEKQLTTPEYYPLTLKSLSSACNQKSNRDPVISYEETAIVRGIDGLREKGLAIKAYKADSRVPKYEHQAGEKLGIDLCELMLRGPQTVGELRSRASRMHPFAAAGEVESVLARLSTRTPPLVAALPREPGKREPRSVHLLGGVPRANDGAMDLPDEVSTRQVRAENARIAALEGEVRALRQDLDSLREAFQSFKSQFEG
jgi:uncharacterized protein YceH (UPF0502 family)